LKGDSVFVSELAVVFEFRFCCHWTFNIFQSEFIAISILNYFYSHTKLYNSWFCMTIHAYALAVLQHHVLFLHDVLLQQVLYDNIGCGFCMTIEINVDRKKPTPFREWVSVPIL
jgi:hypothetical protein